MKMAIKVFKVIIDPYIAGTKVLYWGIKEFGKLVYHYPRHSIVVVAVTSAFTIMAVTLLVSSDLQFLPSWMLSTMPFVIGGSTFAGSICWTIKSFGVAPH